MTHPNNFIEWTLTGKEYTEKAGGNPNHEPAGTPKGGQFASGAVSGNTQRLLDMLANMDEVPNARVVKLMKLSGAIFDFSSDDLSELNHEERVALAEAVQKINIAVEKLRKSERQQK